MYYVAGLLHTNRTGEIEGGKARVGCYEEVLNMENMSRQDLLQLDWEGRCLVTDHGSFGRFNGTSVFSMLLSEPLCHENCLAFSLTQAFYIHIYIYIHICVYVYVCVLSIVNCCAVLFNLYGPSVGPDNEERYEFKLRFYRALQVFSFSLLSI